MGESIPARLEVNLFHRSGDRINKIVKELEKQGAKTVYGTKGNAKIPGLEHDRGICDKDGIFSADVILVPLEDGDRCQALIDIDKTVIAIDLNPLSRTAKTASITIVDNVVRAIPNIEKWVKKQKSEDVGFLKNMVNSFDNTKNIQDVLSFISKKLV